MVSVQCGLSLGQGPQLIEHAGDILRHTNLIGLCMVGLGSRPVAFIAQGRAQTFKFRIDNQVHALQKTRDGQWSR
jgi:hypothetical protein